MPVKPLDIFLQAEMFRVASHSLYALQIESQSSALLVPLWVNQAFTCELYLKCLLAMTDQPIPRHHILHDLFDPLPEAAKARVVLCYDELRADREDSADLRSELEAGSKVFEKLRYAYEGIPEMRNGFPLPIEAMRKVISEIHPEWPPTRDILL